MRILKIIGSITVLLIENCNAACPEQSVTALSTDALTFEAIPSSIINQVSADAAEAYFQNLEIVTCPITETGIVDTDGNALSAELQAVLFIDIEANGFKITVNQADYTGGTINAQLYALTEYGQRVYKQITVTQKQCTKQTLRNIITCPGVCSGTNCDGYRGRVSVTTSGKTCQRWTDSFPHIISADLGADIAAGNLGLGDHNYCRNPTPDTKSNLWCYTNDAGTETEDCDVADEVCTNQNAGMVLEATEGVTDILNSPDDIRTMFTNDNEGLCPITYTIALVDTIDSNYAAGLINKFTIDADWASASAVEIPFDESSATQIDTYSDDPQFAASKAFDGNAATATANANEGVGNWWKANLQSLATISQVIILNMDYYGERLAQTTVHVGDELCGSVEDGTQSGLSYTVNCVTPIVGSSIKLTTVQSTFLSIAGIQAFGNQNLVKFDQTDYAGNVIHLLVTATTAANLPLTERIDVIPTGQTCNKQTVAYNDNEIIWYKALVYADSTITGATVADLATQTDPNGICTLTTEHLASDKVSELNTVQKRVLSINSDGQLVVNSELYDGQNFQSWIKMDTEWDQPIWKEVRVSRLPNFVQTVGLCKVVSDGDWPADTVTFDDVADLAACQENCLSNSLCTGYQWITDPSKGTARNCAAFLETQPVAGDGSAGFACYFNKADGTKPLQVHQNYVLTDGNCQQTEGELIPTGKTTEGVFTREVCQEFCDLEDACKFYEYQVSTQKCYTFTDVDTVIGNGVSDFQCAVKQDPPTLTFGREPGACARYDEIATTNLRTEVAVDVAACQAVCQKYHVTCFGFDFSTDAEDVTTCRVYTETNKLIGDETTGTTCFIRETEQEQQSYAPPDPVITNLNGKCAREDTEAITQSNDEGVVADEAACKALCTGNGPSCTAFQYNTEDKTCTTFSQTETLIGDLSIYQCNILSDTTQIEHTESACVRADGVALGNGLTATQVNDSGDDAAGWGFCQTWCTDRPDCNVASYESPNCDIYYTTEALVAGPVVEGEYKKCIDLTLPQLEFISDPLSGACERPGSGAVVDISTSTVADAAACKALCASSTTSRCLFVTFDTSNQECILQNAVDKQTISGNNAANKECYVGTNVYDNSVGQCKNNDNSAMPVPLTTSTVADLAGCKTALLEYKQANSDTGIAYEFKSDDQQCVLYDTITSATARGDHQYEQCNTVVQQVDPNAPTWKTMVGSCKREDLQSITKFIDEGVVVDDAACKALCTNNILRCWGYQFTEADKTCSTFTETSSMIGNEGVGVSCTIKEKPLEQTFTSYTGKCARTDSASITMFQDQGVVEDIDACKKLCSDTCSPTECTCKGYQFRSEQKTCLTFTDTTQLIGDTTPGYKCFVEQPPFEDKLFTLEMGQCKRKDQEGTTLTKIEGVVFDRDACIALCKASTKCTASQFQTQNKNCITFSETEPMNGVEAEGFECYLRQIVPREYNELPGFCKLKDDILKTPTGLINNGALEKAKCQEKCDNDPTKCFAFQIDTAEGVTNKCVIFSEDVDMTGDEEVGTTCYVYKLTVEELATKTAAEKIVAVEKSTLIHHYMTGFTAKMGHLQVVLNSLEDEPKNTALKCISAQQKPTDTIGANTSYEDTSAALGKITDGFFECLKAQNPVDVEIGGFCGPPSEVEGQEPFTCVADACCGEGLATGAGKETAVYTCQKTGTVAYKPLKMKGYEQFDAKIDWPFACSLKAQTMLVGLTSFMIAAIAYLI